MADSILNGKRVLAVDDEPDVLDTLEDLLDDYDGLVLDTAIDYDTGYHLLRSWTYDAVILDIMGVRGYDLLNAAVHLGFPTVMLTAHAFSAEDLKRSIKLGAHAYIRSFSGFQWPKKCPKKRWQTFRNFSKMF